MQNTVQKSPLILASQSPRRKRLLESAGLSFSVVPSQCEEIVPADGGVEEKALALARRKALDVAPKHPESLILGADTMVALEEEILGKPRNPDHARQMLSILSGRTHTVCTGVFAICEETGIEEGFCAVTRVAFKKLSPGDIEWYLGTGKPFDKAGAYGIQGPGAFLVREISGSYSNVVGLPVCEVVGLLDRLGVLDRLRD